MSWKSIIDADVATKSSTLALIRENRAIFDNSFNDIMEYDIKSLKDSNFNPYAITAIKETNPLYESTKSPILDAFIVQRIKLYGEAILEYTSKFESISVANNLLSTDSIVVYSTYDKEATVTIYFHELMQVVRERMQRAFPWKK